MDKGLLIIVSGFSGAGKGAIVREIMRKHNDYGLSVSATTRQPRPGEIDGKHYFFISRDEFEKKIAGDELLEYAGYVDNYYGTPREYVEKMLEQGMNVILEIEMQGAMKVKARMPEAITVFVSTTDVDTLESRLNGRGTESGEQIRKRLERAVEESDYMMQYDYLLVNDNLEETADILDGIVRAEHKKTKYNLDFISSIQKELKFRFGNN